VSLLAGGAGRTLAGRGGGGAREPDLGQRHEDLPAPAKGRAESDFAVTVPVYFHVVTDGAADNLRDSQIADQIRVLNTTFAGGEGGFDTGFSFVLAGVTRTNNPAWFNANPGGVNEKTMKQTLHEGGSDALNLYTTTRRRLPGLGLPAGHRHQAGPSPPRRHRRRLGVAAARFRHLSGPVRPGRDGDARGRPLAEPRAHLLRREG
jgi:hypothetical protein